jgi:hypothetical protein
MRTMNMSRSRRSAGSRPAAVVLVAALSLGIAACESGTGPGVGTAGGAALGAGVGRAAFGNNTGAMLIGGAVGGLAGNMTVDRAAQEREFQRQQAGQDAAAQRQLDFERQRMLQEEATRRQIEEQRLFEEWRRQQG